MASREIAHVDVVTHTGSVGRVVIVAKDVYALALADRHLRDVREQVVGDALGVLAHESRGVCPDGVEVAEKDDVPLGVCRVEVGEDLLDHPLGPAIGVGCGLLGALLGERELVGVAVDRGGAGEDDVLATVVAHHVDEREGVAQVVGVVLDGLAHGLANCLEAGEVDHAVDVVLVKDGVHGLAVIDVGAVEGEVGGSGVAHDGLDAVDDLLGGVG